MKKRTRPWLVPRDKKGWRHAAFRLGVILLMLLFGLQFMTRMPGSSHQGPLPALSGTEQELAVNLRRHVEMLAGRIGERNVWRPPSMPDAAAYIAAALTGQGYRVDRQEFVSYGASAANLEAAIDGTQSPPEILVLGAHYDTVQGSPGANDNGSGVAAMLELARLLRSHQPRRTIRLVAFANEEPPFYFSAEMGSHRYAARSKERGEKIVAMLALETMGHYDDRPGSQRYPMPFGLFYPDRANFIAFVGNLQSRALVRQVVGRFRARARIPSEGVAAPGLMHGIGWSDHWSFWQHGYPALMVTDTAFFRYQHYHTAADTPEKLDYQRLALVVSALQHAVLELANAP